MRDLSFGGTKRRRPRIETAGASNGDDVRGAGSSSGSRGPYNGQEEARAVTTRTMTRRSNGGDMQEPGEWVLPWYPMIILANSLVET